jgi:hypothetical protein
MQRQFGNYTFQYICNIQLLTEADGHVRTFMPPQEYKNRKGLLLPIHEYGQGPFCYFRIPKNLLIMGVYILTVNDEPYYVGECENLSKRYNTGYGQISARNCFKGGQSTNCRINMLIFESYKNGSKIELWFLRTDKRKEIESELIPKMNVRQRWNRKG